MDKIDKEIKAEAKPEEQIPKVEEAVPQVLDLSSEIEFKPDECEISLLRTDIVDQSEVDLELGTSNNQKKVV